MTDSHTQRLESALAGRYRIERKQFDVDPTGERLLVIVEAGTTGFGRRDNRVLVLDVFNELKVRQGR